MITSCAASMQECLLATRTAQFALERCIAIANQPAITEHHIAHAIAVFSELGIGVASAAIFDPSRWRERTNNANRHNDAVARQDLLSQAKKMGIGLIIRGQMFFATSSRWRLIKYYFLPVISIILGCIALFGMSGLILDVSDYWWLFFGTLSFICSIILPIIMSTGLGEQPKVADSLLTTLQTKID